MSADLPPGQWQWSGVSDPGLTANSVTSWLWARGRLSEFSESQFPTCRLRWHLPALCGTDWDQSCEICTEIIVLMRTTNINSWYRWEKTNSESLLHNLRVNSHAFGWFACGRGASGFSEWEPSLPCTVLRKLCHRKCGRVEEEFEHRLKHLGRKNWEQRCAEHSACQAGDTSEIFGDVFESVLQLSGYWSDGRDRSWHW